MTKSNERSLENAASPDVVLAHTIYGTPVEGLGGVEHANGDIQRATQWSTAPYVPPKRRDRDNPDRLLCSFEDCKAFPMKTTPYCAGHAKSLGLAKWKNGGRPKKESTPDGDTG